MSNAGEMDKGMSLEQWIEENIIQDGLYRNGLLIVNSLIDADDLREFVEGKVLVDAASLQRVMKNAMFRPSGLDIRAYESVISALQPTNTEQQP